MAQILCHNACMQTGFQREPVAVRMTCVGLSRSHTHSASLQSAISARCCQTAAIITARSPPTAHAISPLFLLVCYPIISEFCMRSVLASCKCVWGAVTHLWDLCGVLSMRGAVEWALQLWLKRDTKNTLGMCGRKIIFMAHGGNSHGLSVKSLTHLGSMDGRQSRMHIIR